MIIAVDGPDGSSKTTIVDLLRDYYWTVKQREDIRVVRHPGATAIGKELRRIVKDPQFNPVPMVSRLIFTADSLQFESEFLPFSEAGGVVLCDRFNRATDLVYGACDGLDLSKIATLHDLVGLKAVADYYFVFQGPEEVFWGRKESRAKGQTKQGVTSEERCRIEEQGRAYAAKICGTYNGLHAYREGPIVSCSGNELQEMLKLRTRRVIPINADRSSKEILADILKYLGEA